MQFLDFPKKFIEIFEISLSSGPLRGRSENVPPLGHWSPKIQDKLPQQHADTIFNPGLASIFNMSLNYDYCSAQIQNSEDLYLISKKAYLVKKP